VFKDDAAARAEVLEHIKRQD
ncbi:GTP cyclohydrolase I FolE, partial [Bacillus spizizenii]|nr:GTP cyclohydrolase I FolE [Bacillus spizizenii]